MVKALFDTNILVDFLNAVPQTRKELERYGEKAISIITWMEVMIGANAEARRKRASSSTLSPSSRWGTTLPSAPSHCDANTGSSFRMP